MAYNAQIPQATDQLSQSQSDILGNFSALGAIGGNSNPASAALDPVAGLMFLNLTSQGTQPPVTFPTTSIGLYASPDSATGNTVELYANIKRLMAGTVTQIPMTQSTISNTTPVPGQNTTGYTYLPSGIILQWGMSGPTGNLFNLATVTFSFPFPNQCLSVMVTSMGAQNPPNVPPILYISPTLTKNNFQIAGYNGMAAGNNFYNWLAIGY